MIALRPRRVLVFVPGSVLSSHRDPLRKFAADCLLGTVSRQYIPDGLIFDLEDSVAPCHKHKALLAVESFLCNTPNHTCLELILRINRPTHAHDAAPELQLAEHPSLHTIMLPKVDGKHITELLAACQPTGRQVIPLVETCAGYRDLSSILSLLTIPGHHESGKATHAFPLAAPPCIALGLDDLCADMRVQRDAFFDEAGLSAVLAGVVMMSRSFNVLTIGPVYNKATDDARLITENRRLKAMGYSGALCVFPRQVRLLKKVYSPTSSEVELAHAVLEGLSIAAKTGRGWTFCEGVKYDLAEKPKFEWLLEHARTCALFD